MDDGVISAPVAADAKERLEAGDVAAGDLLAASHMHRYELAASLLKGLRVLDLCSGTGYGSAVLVQTAAAVHGVDVAPEAIAQARETAAVGDRVTFELADAHTYVRGLGADAFDAIVCFEGIEHVPDPDALGDELARLAGAGVRLLVSVPNDRGFDESNHFHVTAFGHDEMRALAARLGATLVLEQRLAEASVIAPEATTDGPLNGRYLVDPDDGPETANHWLLLRGFPAEDVVGVTTRLSVAAAAFQSRYMRDLERANADLRRTNARLGRQWLGIHDAAAGIVVRRQEEALERARAAEFEAKKWKDIADANDWARAAAEARFQAARYRAVDAVRDRLLAIPGGRVLGRAGRRLAGRPR